jgi:hypothetical protein
MQQNLKSSLESCHTALIDLSELSSVTEHQDLISDLISHYEATLDRVARCSFEAEEMARLRSYLLEGRKADGSALTDADVERDEMMDEETGTMMIGERKGLVDFVEVWKASVEVRVADYERKSESEKYGGNEEYVEMRKAIWGALYPNKVGLHAQTSHSVLIYWTTAYYSY